MFGMTVIEFIRRGCSVDIAFIRDHVGPKTGFYQVELLGNGTPAVHAEGKFLSQAITAFDTEVEKRKAEIDMSIIPLD
jgi:hypothetical protein